MLRFLSIALVALALGRRRRAGKVFFITPSYSARKTAVRWRRYAKRWTKCLVQGPNYVVIQFSRKTNYVAGLKLYKTKESDYIRRPLRVTVQNRDEVQFLNSIGMDIWEVKENYVFGAGDGLCD